MDQNRSHTYTVVTVLFLENVSLKIHFKTMCESP